MSRPPQMTLNPFNLATDSALAFVAPALDPRWVAPQLAAALAQPLTVQAIHVLRHKPGRRCLIAYDLMLADDPTPVRVLGKVRSRGLDCHSYRLQLQLWQSGFDDSNPDGISVPQPLGVLPEVNMWLQRYIPGIMATQALTQNSLSLPHKIAQALTKLHRSGQPTVKQHTLADELQILQERVPQVLQDFPEWQLRITRVLRNSTRLAEALPPATTTGIHRDFYPDQVLISGDRLYLLDLDLYCAGDPALDMGNFIAHLTELSLRTQGTPDGFAHHEAALTHAFCQMNRLSTPAAVQIYKVLSLVRHIYISSQICERRAITPKLLQLCEGYLGRIIHLS